MMISELILCGVDLSQSVVVKISLRTLIHLLFVVN